MLFIGAAVDGGAGPSGRDSWQPYVVGDIEEYYIDHAHHDMCGTASLAAIGRILAPKL